MIKQIIDWLEKTLTKINYMCTSNRIKNLFFTTKLFLKFRFFPRMRHIYTAAYLLEGKEKNSKEDFSVLLFSNDYFLSYFSEKLFFDKPRIDKLGEVNIWKINHFLKQFNKKTDMAIVKTDILFIHKLQKKGFLIIPEYGEAGLDTTDPLEELFKRFKKSAKEDVSKIKNYKYTYEITYDNKKLDYFYNELYLPFISSRHGKLAFTETTTLNLSDTKRILNSRKGFLLLLKEKGKYIAGSVILTGEKIAYPISLGIDVRSYYLSERVSSALYYFYITWAKENGLKYLKFGDVNPFLNDGILRFKLKWGMHIKLSKIRFGIFGFYFNKIESKAVISLLKNNPPIFITKNKLNGFVFTDGFVLAEDIIDIYKKYFFDGLKHLFIFSDIQSVKQYMSNSRNVKFNNETIMPLDTTPKNNLIFSGIIKIGPIHDNQEIKINYDEGSIKCGVSENNIDYLVNEYYITPLQAKQIILYGYQKHFEQLVNSFPNNKKDIVDMFLIKYPRLIKKKIDVKKIRYEELYDIFSAINESKISKDSIFDLLIYLAKNPTKKLNDAIEFYGLTILTDAELDVIIGRITDDKKDFIRQKGSASHKPLMGVIMNEVKGRAEGKTVSKILNKKIEKILK